MVVVGWTDKHIDDTSTSIESCIHVLSSTQGECLVMTPPVLIIMCCSSEEEERTRTRSQDVPDPPWDPPPCKCSALLSCTACLCASVHIICLTRSLRRGTVSQRNETVVNPMLTCNVLA